MKKQQCAGACLLALVLGIQMMPLQEIWASQVRVEETEQLLENALSDLETQSYKEGEALVSLEAASATALTQEGAYRYDPAVQIEAVSSFGTDAQSGKETYVVHLVSDTYTTEELMQLALQQYYVDGVSANGYQKLMSSDPYADYQWYLDGAGTSGEGIRWSQQQVTEADVPVIAVIDTGVDYTHPDLNGCMWDNPYPGTLEGSCGYDFGDDDADPMDVDGHGTHVAGIAAAVQDNGIGITGVSQARIMALKVTEGDSEQISDSTIIEAYEYIYRAMEAGVNIRAVNCSWGGSADTSGLLSMAVDVVGEMGALSVFAAGNDHVNWDQTRKALVTPYDLDSPYVVIVGASNEEDETAYYSDYGVNEVDLFAPGSNMLSTYTADTYIPGIYSDSRRRQLSVYFNRFSEDAGNILPVGQTWESFYTAQEIGLPTIYSVDVKKMKDGDNGYLKLSVTRRARTGGEEVAGSIYVDVTDLHLDQNATYYVGFLEGESSGGEVSWDSETMVSTPQESRFVTVADRTYMRIVGLSINAGVVGTPLTWYLDDIAISAADIDTQQFGAYTYLTGTSMATPVVSAAVATLAAANPTMSAETLRGWLMKCVRKVDALSDQCITGGIIDLSKLKTLASKVTLNRKQASVRYGQTLKLTAFVSPGYVTDGRVTWKSSNQKYAVVDQNGKVRVKRAGIGHTVKITATAADGSKKYAVCRIRIKRRNV